MNLTEFKAWFEGYTEEIKTPSAKQWEKIKARVAEIDGTPVTERIYVDRYWPCTYPQYTYWPPRYGYVSQAHGVHSYNGQIQSVGDNTIKSQSFNSTAAMYSLGKAEAQVTDKGV